MLFKDDRLCFNVADLFRDYSLCHFPKDGKLLLYDSDLLRMADNFGLSLLDDDGR